MKVKKYEEYRIAFAEVNYILENSNAEIKNKISKSLLEMIEKNMNKNYIVNFDLDDGLDKCKLQKETKNILRLIYKTYLCSEEEKQKIIEEEKQYKKVIEEKYNYDNLFKKHRNIESNNKEEIIEEVALIPYESKKLWFIKVFQKLKKFLKGDRK